MAMPSQWLMPHQELNARTLLEPSNSDAIFPGNTRPADQDDVIKKVLIPLSVSGWVIFGGFSDICSSVVILEADRLVIKGLFVHSGSTDWASAAVGS